MANSNAHSGEISVSEDQRPTPFGDLLTIRQAAEYLGCSETTVRNRTRDKSLTAVRMGPRLVRIRRDDLDMILQPYDVGQAGRWAYLR